jgi:hypothetical protein
LRTHDGRDQARTSGAPNRLIPPFRVVKSHWTRTAATLGWPPMIPFWLGEGG